MKKDIFKLGIVVVIVLFTSCQKRMVQLPQVVEVETVSLTDISPIYIFYNEKAPNDVEVNRKNLISTTHWIFHVDKRNGLEQAGEAIEKLQLKKQNQKAHKNEASQNYFSVSDSIHKELAFVNFTEWPFRVIQEEALDTIPLTSSNKLIFGKDKRVWVNDYEISYDTFDEHMDRLLANELVRDQEWLLVFHGDQSFQEFMAYFTAY